MRLAIARYVGVLFLHICQTVGRVSIFIGTAMGALLNGTFFMRAFLRQLVSIGYYSLPVVALTAIFTGAVLALQSYTGFSRFNAESSVASVVVLSITRELGPVLAGLMLAGRVSAAIAAEIGSMRVTEQIDVLYTLHVNPMQYLIVPRILAGVIVLPILVIVADIIGVLGGYLVSVYKLGFISSAYLEQTLNILEYNDVMSGLIKAAFFGFIVTAMGCYQGYYSERGAQGVGRATTNAVVSSSILILVSNYLITGILFGQGG